MATSGFSISMVGFDPPPSTSAFTGGISCSDKFSRTGLTNGSGDDQLDAVRCLKTLLAPSGSTQIDLRDDADRYGVTTPATDLVAIIVQNLGDGSGAAGGDLLVAAPLSDGFTGFLASIPGGTDVPGIPLLPFTGFSYWSFVAGTTVIGAANKLLNISETGTSLSAQLEFQAWVRR